MYLLNIQIKPESRMQRPRDLCVFPWEPEYKPKKKFNKAALDEMIADNPYLKKFVESA